MSQLGFIVGRMNIYHCQLQHAGSHELSKPTKSTNPCWRVAHRSSSVESADYSCSRSILETLRGRVKSPHLRWLPINVAGVFGYLPNCEKTRHLPALHIQSPRVHMYERSINQSVIRSTKLGLSKEDAGNGFGSALKCSAPSKAVYGNGNKTGSGEGPHRTSKRPRADRRTSA